MGEDGRRRQYPAHPKGGANENQADRARLAEHGTTLALHCQAKSRAQRERGRRGGRSQAQKEAPINTRGCARRWRQQQERRRKRERERRMNKETYTKKSVHAQLSKSPSRKKKGEEKKRNQPKWRFPTCQTSANIKKRATERVAKSSSNNNRKLLLHAWVCMRHPQTRRTNTKNRTHGSMDATERPMMIHAYTYRTHPGLCCHTHNTTTSHITITVRGFWRIFPLFVLT